MKTFLITTLVIWGIQVLSLVSSIVTDYMMVTSKSKPEEKFIQSKKDILKFFIPYFWVMPSIRGVIRYWNSLP